MREVHGSPRFSLGGERLALEKFPIFPLQVAFGEGHEFLVRLFEFNGHSEAFAAKG